MAEDKLPCPNPKHISLVVSTLRLAGQKPGSLLSLVTTYPRWANLLSVVPGKDLQTPQGRLQPRRQNCELSLQEQMKSSLNIWLSLRQQLLHSCEESQGRHPNSLKLEYLS